MNKKKKILIRKLIYLRLKKQQNESVNHFERINKAFKSLAKFTKRWKKPKKHNQK